MSILQSLVDVHKSSFLTIITSCFEKIHFTLKGTGIYRIIFLDESYSLLEHLTHFIKFLPCYYFHSMETWIGLFTFFRIVYLCPYLLYRGSIFTLQVKVDLALCKIDELNSKCGLRLDGIRIPREFFFHQIIISFGRTGASEFAFFYGIFK